jgi:hypothetical protein
VQPACGSVCHAGIRRTPALAVHAEWGSRQWRATQRVRVCRTRHARVCTPLPRSMTACRLPVIPLAGCCCLVAASWCLLLPVPAWLPACLLTSAACLLAHRRAALPRACSLVQLLCCALRSCYSCVAVCIWGRCVRARPARMSCAHCSRCAHCSWCAHCSCCAHCWCSLLVLTVCSLQLLCSLLVLTAGAHCWCSLTVLTVCSLVRGVHAGAAGGVVVRELAGGCE